MGTKEQPERRESSAGRNAAGGKTKKPRCAQRTARRWPGAPMTWSSGRAKPRLVAAWTAVRVGRSGQL